jgi:hypothetical protein
VLPVHTFGAPSMMCGGDHLLEELGLPANHVVNIVMHRDIVPRAFACDYPDNVVEVLRRMGGGFKEHACLKNLVIHCRSSFSSFWGPENPGCFS